MPQTSGSRTGLAAIRGARFLPIALMWAWLFPMGSASFGETRSVTDVAASHPQQSAANEQPGFWRPALWSSPYGAACGLTPAQIKTVHEKLRQISDVFLETAVLKSPVGFEGKIFYTAGSDRGIKRKNQMPPSAFDIFLFDYIQTDPRRSIEPVVESRCQVTLSINDIDLLYSQWQKPLQKDDVGPIYVEPRRAGEFFGFPIYEVNRGPYVLITKDIGRPVWIPVSRERYILAIISERRKLVEKMKPPHDQSSRADIAELEAQLAGMSSAERSSQAYVGGYPASRKSGLSSANDPKSQALVATNPSFFDLTRPNTSFQMAILETYPRDLLGPRHAEGFIWKKLLEGLKNVDWKRVASLLQ